MSIANGKLPNAARDDHETTLEDLLRDDSFGMDSFTTANDEYDSPEYCECLTTFVEGNSEECVKKLLNYGFLDPHVLRSGNDVLDLFLAAFVGIKDLSSLSGETQESINGSLKAISDEIWRYPNDLPMASRMLLVSQYCQCCAKLFSADPIRYSDNSSSLESNARKAIIQFSSELPEGAEEGLVLGLQHVVQTYLFDIQIGLLKRVATVSLYQKICADATPLSPCFQKTTDTHSGRPIEELILGRLEPKQQFKSKNFGHGRQSHHAQPRPSSIVTPVSPRASDASLSGVAKTKIGQNPQNVQSNQLEAISKWTHRWLRYFSKIHFSRQTALVVLLLLLISTKNLKKFAAVPACLSVRYRRLLPHLSDLLRLLSSI